MSCRSRDVAVCLTDDVRATLTELSGSRTAPAHHVERAGIILQLVAGRSASEIAMALRIDRLAAVDADRAINNLPRTGRPPDITPAGRAWLIGEACIKPKGRGYPHELWTLRLLATHARDNAAAASHPCLAELAASTVHAILHANAIKPHKVRYDLECRDPAFEDRMAAVVETYAAAEMLRDMPAAERPAAILSHDEKPGIQAVAITAPDLPPRPGQHPTLQRDHECKRLGTVTLCAAADLVTGTVHHAVTERHRSREFVAFLRTLDSAYPVGMLICILLDNHSAHRSRETRCYLDHKSDRFELVFTPTHASWLNWIETFFSKTARSVLRHIRVASKAELTSCIGRYIEKCNLKPILFTLRSG